MSEGSRSRNAFSEEYQALLRERDEPEGPWAGDAAKPLVIWQQRDGFGLFRPWQDPRAGDEPLAVFTDLADARLAVVARSLIRRTRYYQLRDPQYPHPAEGYAILREGEEKGRVRLFDPELIDVMNVLTCYLPVRGEPRRGARPGRTGNAGGSGGDPRPQLRAPAPPRSRGRCGRVGRGPYLLVKAPGRVGKGLYPLGKAPGRAGRGLYLLGKPSRTSGERPVPVGPDKERLARRPALG